MYVRSKISKYTAQIKRKQTKEVHLQKVRGKECWWTEKGDRCNLFSQFKQKREHHFSHSDQQTFYASVEDGVTHINNPEVKERFESCTASDKFHMLIVFSQVYWYCS